jgi:hypothetical protein
MAELVRAHATYRFVVLDEEEERPRILVRHPSYIPCLKLVGSFLPKKKKDMAFQAEHAAVVQGQ